MLKSSVKRCPNCRTKCVSKTKLKNSDSTIIFAEGPPNLVNVAKNEKELRTRIWAYMRPPRISEPTPLVDPARLEKVKTLLYGTERDDALETYVESELSIRMMSDGSIRKSRSHKELKIYPPTMSMEKQSTTYCTPDCKQASENEMRELFRRAECNLPPKFGR